MRARILGQAAWVQEHPGLYKVMHESKVGMPFKEAAFARTTAAVQRCMDAGVAPPGDAATVALDLRTAVIGMLSLRINEPLTCRGRPSPSKPIDSSPSSSDSRRRRSRLGPSHYCQGGPGRRVDGLDLRLGAPDASAIANPALILDCGCRRVRVRLSLGGWADEDLVEGHAAGAGDGERDDLGDVVGGDGQLLVHLLGRLLGVSVGDVVGQLGGDGSGLDDHDPNVGLEFLAQRFGIQLLRPHLVAA